MKETNNLQLYASPDSIRLFWGYKLEIVSREKFNKDLGETFMPGTPAVLAPMGLNGYLPAVLNLDMPSKYPDEVALIVYPSLELYNEARQDNLLGRIYTYSHMGVFDMAKSRGQWPGTVEEPIKHSVFERWAWRVFNKPLDWQKGQARLITMESNTTKLYEFLLNFSKNAKQNIADAGVEEMIVQCTERFATIWFFSTTSELQFDLKKTGLDMAEIKILNDLYSEPLYLRNGNEKAEITGAKFIQFRFPRELRFYL